MTKIEKKLHQVIITTWWNELTESYIAITLSKEREKELGRLLFKRKREYKNILGNGIDMNKCDEIMIDAIKREDVVIAMYLFENGIKLKKEIVEKIKDCSEEFQEMMVMMMFWN